MILAQSNFNNFLLNLLDERDKICYINYIVFCCDSCADLTAWRTFLGTKNIQLSAKTSTPTTVQLTPEEITAFIGTNNLWSDTNGNASVEYKMGVQEYIDSLQST